jgi:GNAT superfamily N-acetyltransferase
MGLPADLLSSRQTSEPSHERHDRAPNAAPKPHWIPVRALAERHRPRILAHLLALPEHDRYLRFGHAASDAQLARYTDLIDFGHDEVLGIFNRRLALVGMAHLAALPGAQEAEFGVSVLPAARGKGLGARLFDHAGLRARNRGVHTLLMHALADNTPMLRIARQAGADIERAGGEAVARLHLPQHDLRSQWDQWIERGAAEVDYRLKHHARRLSAAIDTVGELKDQLADIGPER